MPEPVKFSVALTSAQTCSYLPEQQEQLLLIQDKALLNPPHYERLMMINFRRSGDDIYRPHCPFCTACSSLRIDAPAFTPSRSQKRVLTRNQDVSIKMQEEFQPEHYQLYERYIRLRHADGSMFPPSEEQYQRFLACSWLKPLYLEFYLEEQLIAVAVTDRLPDSISAMYTFFEPDLEERSLGALAILTQIRLAQGTKRRWVYLGYQVDGCRKMNYKQQYKPHQIYVDNQWL